MPNEQNPSQARRPHVHRPRRGPDRRGQDRRPAPPPPEGGTRETTDVEQIMRDIRARIVTRHGVELTPEQVRELAARRLDAILEPRHIKPELMEQLRRSAGEPVAVPQPAAEPLADVDEAALSQSHRPLLGLARRWLRPILKLFFNPAPLVEALAALTRRSRAAAAREAELLARQAEWNALHYEVLQRLVTDVSRATLDAQQLAMRVESLSAKVDFNERRVRDMEHTVHGGRPVARPSDVRTGEPPAAAAGATSAPDTADPAAGDGSRRRRRRRRGRRSTGVPLEGGPATTETDAAGEADEPDFDSEGGDLESSALAGPMAERAAAAGEGTAPPADVAPDTPAAPVEAPDEGRPAAAPAWPPVADIEQTPLGGGFGAPDDERANRDPTER